MLHGIFKKYGCDKHEHKYASLYEHIAKIKEPDSIMEIGIYKGASMMSWRERFKESFLIAIDIDITHIEFTPQDPYYLIHADFRNFKPSIFLDWIIDDGSHTKKDVLDAFAKFWSFVKPGGWYIIEDLHCAFWYDFMKDINQIISERTHNNGIEADKTQTGFVIQQKSIIAIQKALI